MFEKVQIAPPDPILGLTEMFKADPNPDKINLSVGSSIVEIERASMTLNGQHKLQAMLGNFMFMIFILL